MNIEIVNNEYNLPPYKHYIPVLKGKNNDNNTLNQNPPQCENVILAHRLATIVSGSIKKLLSMQR